MQKKKRRRRPLFGHPVMLFVVCKCPDCDRQIILRGKAFEVGQHDTETRAIYHAYTLAGLSRMGGAKRPAMVLVADGKSVFGRRGRGCDELHT